MIYKVPNVSDISWGILNHIKLRIVKKKSSSNHKEYKRISQKYGTLGVQQKGNLNIVCNGRFNFKGLISFCEKFCPT